MKLAELENKLSQISDLYAEQYKINRTDDWFILKIQEELGELAAAHLKCTARGRIGQQSSAELNQNFKDELADVIALAIIFATHKGLKTEDILRDKWFKYLPK